MSEYDVSGDHGTSGLSEAHQDYNSDQDGSQSLQAAGSSHAIEFDEHVVHVHHVEYDDAQGNHYEETSYEVVDVHVVETENSLAVTDGNVDAASSFGDLGFFHDDLESLLHNTNFEDGLDRSLAPGGSDADGISGISEASA
jgi:hypothetical protein